MLLLATAQDRFSPLSRAPGVSYSFVHVSKCGGTSFIMWANNNGHLLPTFFPKRRTLLYRLQRRGRRGRLSSSTGLAAFKGLTVLSGVLAEYAGPVSNRYPSAVVPRCSAWTQYRR